MTASPVISLSAFQLAIALLVIAIALAITWVLAVDHGFDRGMRAMMAELRLRGSKLIGRIDLQ